jgi:D-alanine-D-alanine ligase
MHIGIIYNLNEVLHRGTERDRAADYEVLEVVEAVRLALERNGHRTGVYNVCHNGLASLTDYDAIFNLAESTLGSDVTEDAIAEELAVMGVVFTGSGSTALRRCADKAWTKATLLSLGLPTPRYQLFRTAGLPTDLAYPLIVKPVHEDGSIGITDDSVVCDAEHLARKVSEVLEVYREPALVEEFIDGREINAAVLGNGSGAVVLPLSEIIFTLAAGKPRIVSRNAKWRADSDEYWNTNNSCPAKLHSSVEGAIRELALRAYRAMDCTGYARVDIRVKESQPYLLEVNPNPCINPVGAGFIVSAKAAGLSYDEVVDAILACAFARQPVASCYA